MSKNKDTIFALSTPVGKSAIAIIRISGENSLKYIKKISSSPPELPNEAKINTLISEDGTTIDKSITTFYKAPKSFTGEDMVEISVHGSGAVIKKLIKEFKKNKRVRLAEPGEFTRRAFENEKLDLTQAEAIADIVNAETETQRKAAQDQLSGIFSKKTKEIYSKTKNLLANVEATIDFSDEDLPKGLEKKIKEQKENIIKEIDLMLSQSSVGQKIRSGFSVAVIGRPNTGKSSFINHISNYDVAIVTEVPGTTTDIIESYVDINGIPARFFDTAGIRRSKNKIEEIGIKKTLKISRGADINLVFIDNIKQINFFKKIKNTIFVKSKQDIQKKPIKYRNIINISSKTGYGVKKLLKLIYKLLSEKNDLENIHISRERHQESFFNAKNYLVKSTNSESLDISAENIRLSLNEISKIYGRVDIEDILDIIFNDFCIGK